MPITPPPTMTMSKLSCGFISRCPSSAFGQTGSTAMSLASSQTPLPVHGERETVVDFVQKSDAASHFSYRLSSRSEEHTSELQSLMRISYAVFCLKQKTTKKKAHTDHTIHVTSTHTRKDHTIADLSNNNNT